MTAAQEEKSVSCVATWQVNSRARLESVSFRRSPSRSTPDICAALEREDAPAARRLAHALKGGAGSVGLIEVEAAAGRLEAALALEETDGSGRRSADYAALAAAWARAGATMDALLDAAATLLHDNKQGDA